jgi:hypothetical protein
MVSATAAGIKSPLTPLFQRGEQMGEAGKARQTSLLKPPFEKGGLGGIYIKGIIS